MGTVQTPEDVAGSYQWSGQRWYTPCRNIHDAINDLTAQARRLAPKVTDAALDCAMTGSAPTGRRQLIAYDMVAYGFCLNHISNDLVAVEAAGFTLGNV